MYPKSMYTTSILHLGLVKKPHLSIMTPQDYSFIFDIVTGGIEVKGLHAATALQLEKSQSSFEAVTTKL